ncbi:MAG: serine/threonine-protein kinase [candidate division Zixibacteria bacterium]
MDETIMPKNLSSYLLYTLIAVLVISLYLGDFTGMKKLQWKIDDLMYAIKGSSNPASDIIMVNIDDKSVDAIGEWPWDYELVADLVAVCNSAEPKSMLLNLELPSRVAEDTTGKTKILGNQISWTNNIILIYDIALSDYSNQRMSRPEYLYKSSIQVDSDLGLLDEHQALNVRKPFLPSGLICEYTDGLGFIYTEYAPDRTVRWAPIVANYDGFYYPSAALLAAAMHLGYAANEIKVFGGESVKFGSHVVPTDENGRVLINYGTRGSTFKEYSAIDLIDEKINLSNLKSKAVLVNLTATGMTNNFNTPVAEQMPQSELLANIIENIVHANYVETFNFSIGLDILIIIGLGLMFAFILPRVILMYRMIILLVGIIIIANLNYVLFSSYQLMPRFLYFGLEILLMMLATPLLDNSKVGEGGSLELSNLFSFLGKSKDKEDETVSAGNVPVRKLNDIGNEPEFQKTEVLPAQTPELTATGMSNAETSAVESHEDSSTDETTAYDQHQGASISDQIIPAPSSNESVQDPEIEPVASEPLSEFANESPGINAQVFRDADRIESLGRYKVTGVLGKGAMGTVFKGVDPAIDRPVALKTIRLDFVSDEKELSELRDRLFREAQAAGKLSHPNIVTIYDVGSEGTMQYIAMECLEGQVLEDLINKKVQFSYKIIANIIIQICNALNYAHEQGIIHRDIKPANIMVLKDYSVKVMDFGIARVDSSSMTKTGIAMGTPNYISPELLQGKEVDRRCDIFSLGVVIYEMLTGRRPFKGENMTALIYSIINKDPVPPSTINERIPAIYDHIVLNALKKNPVERYQKATDIKKLLVDFVESFSIAR